GGDVFLAVLPGMILVEQLLRRRGGHGQGKDQPDNRRARGPGLQRHSTLYTSPAAKSSRLSGAHVIDSWAPESERMNLNGATALVTGGSNGIGLAIAKTWGAAGARVAITGRDEKRLAAAGKAIGAHAIHADVAKEADVL